MKNEKTNRPSPESESAQAILENVFGASLEIAPAKPSDKEADPVSESGATEEAKLNSESTPTTEVTKEPVSKQEQSTDTKADADAQSEADATQPSGTKPKSDSHADESLLFSELPLSDEVQKAVELAGYRHPTPIQAQIIPHLLFGQDVLAQSQTGSGKTAAFALPILTRIETEISEPQVLVLVPTRELAIQVGNSFKTYGSQLKGFHHAVIYGGQDYEIQYRQLRKGPQVIVGTPGRVIDHIKNGKLDITEIECLVLDEADEMLNMGFLEDVEFVLERMPEDRQIALFSATLPGQIRKISQRYLNEPAKVTIKQKTLTADSIRQRAVIVSPRDRVDMLIRFLEAEEADGAIVFTRTRETTSVVADQLVKAGLRAFALNGEMAQKSRERTIEKLKQGQLDILVATDIAARGLDVSRISHVFNYDLPENPEAYTHRVGRTGRAGKKGEAIIFVSHSQRGRLRFIEKITRQKIEIAEPPSADQINQMRIKRFYANIDKTITERDMHFFEKLVNDFIETSDHPIEKIAAAIAMVSQNGRDFLMKDRPLTKEKRSNSRDKGRARRFNGPPEPGMARFRLSVGRQDGVGPGNIVGAVTNEGNISGDEIGSIRIHHSFSTIDLPEDRADEITDALSDTRISGRALRIRPYEDRPERGRSRDRRHKPSGKPSGKRRDSNRGGKPKHKKGFIKSKRKRQSNASN